MGVLKRFRKEPYALIGDIQSMFHRVRVDPKDADALRFLWWPNGNTDSTPVAYQILVHLFGATSSPACASFAFSQTVHDFGSNDNQAAVEIVLNNFYVDDCLASFNSESEAFKEKHDLVQLLRKGGFHLTKWVTNSEVILSTIPEKERSKSLKCLDIHQSPSQRALGVPWVVQEDSFIFNVSLPDKPLTRRGILSALNSLFDPLGLVSPIALEPKLLLSTLCSKSLSWEDPLNKEDADRWNNWVCSLSELEQLRISRSLKPEDFGEAAQQELHVFSDASSFAYGSCCYLRLVNQQGKNPCCFVARKARVAPIKTVTIPGLEPTAAVLSVRLETLVKKSSASPDVVLYFGQTRLRYCRLLKIRLSDFQSSLPNS